MNKGDTMLAVFNPPSGVELYGLQESFIGQEIRWLAVELDRTRSGHWMMVSQYQRPKITYGVDHNVVSSAHLNQREELVPAPYSMAQHDIDELDRRIATIQKKREALMAKLNRPEEGRIMSDYESGLNLAKLMAKETLPNQLDHNHIKRELMIIRASVDDLLKILS